MTGVNQHSELAGLIRRRLEAAGKDYAYTVEAIRTTRGYVEKPGSEPQDATRFKEHEALAALDSLAEHFDALLQGALALDDQFVAGESVDPDSPEALAFHRLLDERPADGSVAEGTGAFVEEAYSGESATSVRPSPQAGPSPCPDTQPGRTTGQRPSGGRCV